MTRSELDGCLFQAIPGFEDHLEAELGPGARPLPPEGQPPSLYLAPPPEGGAFWFQNRWDAPFRLEFGSISEASRALRAIQRNWAALPRAHFRRTALIAASLPPLSTKPRPFPWLLPRSPMGAFTLLDEHTLAASGECASPFPAGRIDFEEDHEGPPSRAYRKLWEALARCRKWPAPGERCFDAGASPGSWSWALTRLGALVTACDRAPLDPRISCLEGVTYLRHDAFTLSPEQIGPLDWLFCDAACYPARLYAWVFRWLASGLCRNYVCTLKMQGAIGAPGGPDLATVRRFAALGGEVTHLYHNRHELTWTLLGAS